MAETYKLEFEMHKTQATLVTGSLVAVITLAELLVQGSPRYSLALAASCVLLLFSTTAVMLTLGPWSSAEALRVLRPPGHVPTPQEEREISKLLDGHRWASREMDLDAFRENSIMLMGAACSSYRRPHR